MKITQGGLTDAFGPLGPKRTLTKKQRERLGEYLFNGFEAWARGSITRRASRILAEHLGRMPQEELDVPISTLLASVYAQVVLGDALSSEKEKARPGLAKAFGERPASSALLEALTTKAPVSQMAGPTNSTRPAGSEKMEPPQFMGASSVLSTP